MLLKKIALLAVFFSVSFGCLERNTMKEVVVSLPSITSNMDLGETLTYSALVVLNDTSAHLFTLKNDLTIQGDLAKTYETQADKTKYKIYLNPSYESFRKERLSSQDVIYSMNFLASHSAFVKASLDSVRGIDSCTAKSCVLAVKALDEYTIEVELKYPDSNFINKLTNPFFVILKNGKPFLENVGSCQIPYQTGRALLVGCNETSQRIMFKNSFVNLTVGNSINQKNAIYGKVLIDNPGVAPFPSLVVLSLYAIPQSKLSKKLRMDILKLLMFHRQELQEFTKLNPSFTVVSEWFKLNQRLFAGINSFDDFILPIACPADPIKIGLETTLPNVNFIASWLKKNIPCSVDVSVLPTDRYFQQFYKNDFAFLWVTPDYLDYYNIYSVFDCASSNCYFEWHDGKLKKLLDILKDYRTSQDRKEEVAIQIEKYLMSNGYVAPLLQMNTWIAIDNVVKQAHPAGLAQLKASDFLN